MPTSTLTRGALRGATSGLSRLAQAVAGGDQIEQDAYDKTLLNQSRIGQAIATAAKDQAEAELTGAKLKTFNSRPDVFADVIAARAGLTAPKVRAYQQYVRTGEMPTEQSPGPVVAEVPALAPSEQSRISQLIGQWGLLQGNLGDINPEQVAKASETYRETGLGDDVLAGRRTAASVGEAQAAQKGGAITGSDGGIVRNLFSGNLVDNASTSAGLRLKNDQAGAQRANAAQSYAAADNSRASAARTRAATVADGQAGSKPPAGYRWTAGGTGLEPIPGGPADTSRPGANKVKAPTEGQAKALAFASRMQVADEILGELAANGKRLPNLAKQGLEQVPLIGGALGMGANLFSTADQQQIEQAQRDFINAVLRRESGAAISMGEFANARQQYFPQPGDSPQVLAQKAANRQTAIEGFKAEFGDQGQPQFDKIVSGARAARQAAKKPAAAAAPAPTPGGQRNVRVNY